MTETARSLVCLLVSVISVSAFSPTSVYTPGYARPGFGRRIVSLGHRDRCQTPALKELSGCEILRATKGRARRASLLRMSAGGGPGEGNVKEARGEPKSLEVLSGELNKRNRQLTPEEEKAGEVGISQFNEGAGTQYVTKKKSKEDMGSSYVRLVDTKLSYGALVLDRLGDFVGDMINSKAAPVAVKKKIMILGTGWAAHSIIKTIDADAYDVTVISPRNYFVFTPMLAGASTGVVEMRSITGGMSP
jgi:hypothetical protein